MTIYKNRFFNQYTPILFIKTTIKKKPVILLNLLLDDM